MTPKEKAKEYLDDIGFEANNIDLLAIEKAINIAIKETKKEIFNKLEAKGTLNTYLGDTFFELTIKGKDWKKLKQ